MRPFDRQAGMVSVMARGAPLCDDRGVPTRWARGARIYAVGGRPRGTRSASSHGPAPGGAGTRGAAPRLSQRAVHPEQIDYITRRFRLAPQRSHRDLAIKSVFGSPARRLAVERHQGLTGHLMGASGRGSGHHRAGGEESAHPAHINLTDPDETWRPWITCPSRPVPVPRGGEPERRFRRAILLPNPERMQCGHPRIHI